MGYIKHHAIIVSGELDDLRKVRGFARTLCPDLVTEIKEYVVNTGGSFAILPDGSKEGWDESLEMDEKRAKIIEFLYSLAYEDGSVPVDWVEVSFDEEGVKKIL